jgi:NAD(P)-dependent dehydrogenase (short-subunit alcohol dehydrogenase family)
MDTQMKGKNVLVTGSTAGIGKGIAALFAAEGANVFINGRHAETVSVVSEELARMFPDTRIRGIAADLAKPGEADGLYDACTQHGPLDVLVNNVGIYAAVPFKQITDEQWLHLFNVNIMSTVRMCRRALPDMLQRDSGKIINISSESAMRPRGDMAHYSATKSCMVGLTRALAETTKGTRVTVNSVLPAVTWTEGVETLVHEIARTKNIPAEQAKAEYFMAGNDTTSLISRFLTVEEVAKAVLMVACNEGISGSAVLIDGGVIRHI